MRTGVFAQPTPIREVSPVYISTRDRIRKPEISDSAVRGGANPGCHVAIAARGARLFRPPFMAKELTAMISIVSRPGGALICCVASCCTGCGAHGQQHAERRAPTHLRLDPDAPAMHLDNPSRNGEAEAGAALCAGVRAVDLAELLEDPLALFRRDAGPVSLTLTVKWPLPPSFLASRGTPCRPPWLSPRHAPARDPGQPFPPPTGD